MNAHTLPALPPGWHWERSTGWLVDPDGVVRYMYDATGRVDRAKVALCMSNHGFADHAEWWRTGSAPMALATPEPSKLTVAATRLLNAVDAVDAIGLRLDLLPGKRVHELREAANALRDVLPAM
jgi:hypothetical protein